MMLSFNRYRSVLLIGFAAAVIGFWLSPSATAASAPLVFCGAEGNDLYRVMSAGGARYPRYDSPAAAIAAAPRGGAVLILADGYPSVTTTLAPDLLERALKKKLRLYIEYPSSLPGLAAGSPMAMKHGRAVIASKAFAPELERLRILAIHGCRFVPMTATSPTIVMARVAGFDSAVYGLPEKEVYPVLFEHNGMLVATTKLSHFVTGRYMPSDAWAAVWKHVLTWLCPGQRIPTLKWRPDVRPSYGPADALPPDAELQAFQRGIDAYRKAKFFIHPAWKAEFERAVKANDCVARRPKAGWPVGDGSEGVLEGFASRIEHDGSQPASWTVRNDCVGETSFSFALAGRVNGKPEDSRVAANLNDYIYRHSVLSKGPRGDPKSPSFGLVGWHTTPKYFGEFDGFSVYYGDDNARSMLGTIGTAAVLKSDRWDEDVLRCLLANLRTTGRLGFRGGRLDEGPLQRNGWRHYWKGERINYSPHYEAYLWVCYLWAYHKTHYRPFLDRAETAIRMTIAAYPSQWRWTNGIQQERARMLLPLAWLVRVDDTAEHREWLRRITQDMLAFRDGSGAIREELGALGRGRYGPPKSNQEYGDKEAPLISVNGDPVSDIFYTSNFAFLGLHEAAAATGEKIYIDAAGKLAEFLCRIQTRSEAHPELDGWWYRAFEYRRWEYWASNADLGWGAWCIESGWSQSLITAVLGMRHLRTSLWELSAESGIGKHFNHLQPIMIPSE